MKLVITTLAALALLATPAVAQEPTIDDGVVVEELVVRAALPGPAWWRVTNGDSVVFIMGAPMGPVPRDLKWDRSGLERRLTGAKSLIVPGKTSAGFTNTLDILRLRRKMKRAGGLESTLPAPYWRRFVAASTKLGKDARKYADWGPYMGGIFLDGDYRAAHKLAYLPLVDDVTRLGRRHRVRVETNTYNGNKVFEQMIDDSADRQKSLICLGGFLDGVEQDPAQYRRAAQGWAVGDVQAAINVVRGSNICTTVFAPAFFRTQIRDQVDAISEALRTPGKSVAIVSLRELVVQNGVIEQLRARGFEVTDPASLTDRENE